MATTVRTMNTKANKQRLFNKACEGLAAQGFKQSANASGSCRYRSGNKACAVGHLLDDDKMARKWDRECGGGIWDVEGQLEEDYLLVFGDLDVEWLNSLQSCHDDNDTPSGMVEALMDFAKDNGLTRPACLRSFKCQRPTQD